MWLIHSYWESKQILVTAALPMHKLFPNTMTPHLPMIPNLLKLNKLFYLDLGHYVCEKCQTTTDKHVQKYPYL